MTTTQRPVTPTTKHLAELELSERVIRNYILSIDDCDALRITVTSSTITYTPYVLNDTGDYEQSNNCPCFFDVEDKDSEEVQEATLLAALWEFSQERFSDGLVAVDPDSGHVVLYPDYVHVKTAE